VSGALAGAASPARALSPTERRQWLLEQLLPAGVHADTLVLRLVGQLEEAALSAALHLVAERHAILLARVELRGEVPTVLPAGKPVLPGTDDLRGHPAPVDAARRLVEAEAGRPLDSATGPLMRTRLVRVTTTESWLVLRLHTLAADAGSRPRLLADLASAYIAALAGTAPVWPPFPEGCDDETGAAADATAVSASPPGAGPRGAAPPLLELPADRPPPVEPALATLRHVCPLPAATGQRLRAMAQAAKTDLGDVCLATLAALLGRYSDAEVVVVVTPVAPRPVPSGNGVGRFEEYVALPVDLSDDPSLRTLTHRVREVRAAISGPARPLELLPRSPAAEQPAAGRFTQVAFQAGRALQPPLLPGLAVTVELAGAAQPPFELVLVVTDHGDGGAELHWHFSAARFDPVTGARLAAHYETLLGAALDTPDRPLSALEVLPGDERTQLERLGRGAPPPGTPCTLPELFAATVAQHATAQAVRGLDGALTYAELDAASNQLAHRLRRLGGQQGARVAVCLDRSTALVAGLLAVVKTGAAYVPIDPAYPPARVGALLRDAGAVALVTAADLLAGLPPDLPPLVLVDRDPAAGAGPPSGPPAGGPAPEDPAYVIYTSGSTGVPKGVVVRHDSLCNLLRAMAIEPGLRPGETMVGVTTPAFDLSVPDLFLPLVTGARLVLAETSEALDGARLRSLLDRVGADLLQGTPSTWRLLLDSGWTGRAGMRAVLGGEAVPAPLAARVAEHTAGVWNFYGPTEATVWSTAARLDGPEGPGITDPPSIGRPLPGVEVAVVDSADRLVPLGITGELLIGGLGVAAGYLGRPELTDSRFVRLPVSGGRRVYRSGDLVRWRTDGWLEFAGRIDHQVKLRGHRIEPGEVEAALCAQPGIRDAVVVLQEDDADDQRLVAYLAGPSNLDPAEVRTGLARRLPAYMVPTAYVVVEELPRTATGKLDRAALPVRDPVPVGRDRYVAPRTPVEAKIAALWAEVLGVERVGVHDNFFELGGHSLLVLRMAARLPRLLPVSLPVRRLFELSTVESLALAVTQTIAAQSADAELADLLTGLEAPADPGKRRHPVERARWPRT